MKTEAIKLFSKIPMIYPDMNLNYLVEIGVWDCLIESTSEIKN